METIDYLCMLLKPRFDVLFLEDARKFLIGLDDKPRTKVLYNLDKARIVNDPKLFKKLSVNVWEFRTKYNGLQYRLLAFWDKTESLATLVIATHGFVKKVDKVPENELVRAEQLRKAFFGRRPKRI